ncbi:complexin-3-like [Scleropages formosus]|uniref:Complexin-3-like n=1 Tax=Scleropages formosus TaxID=113540 RepID=A0A0P7XQQ8_SCLFO|nr:complexin-3-like [Scleropages formosus]
MDSVVKKTLTAPIKQFTGCISGGKESEGWTKRGGKMKKGSKGKSAPSRTKQAGLDANQMRAYQADLEKERQVDELFFRCRLKLREARNAQKNAERAAMRAHYRSKYRLPKNTKDASHLKTAGGKAALPRELAAMVRPKAQAKDEGNNLFSAFQGLSLNLGMMSGNAQTATATPTPSAPGGEQCRLM